jgi:hypothetical protein
MLYHGLGFCLRGASGFYRIEQAQQARRLELPVVCLYHQMIVDVQVQVVKEFLQLAYAWNGGGTWKRCRVAAWAWALMLPSERRG